MGFQRSALLLEWPEDSEFSGLEVRMRRLSIGQLAELQGLTELHRNGDKAETLKMFGDLLDAIADGLLSWNYEAEVRREDGSTVVEPVPADREGVGGCDVDMVLQLTRAWMQAAAAVPLASAPSSPSGVPALPPEPPDEEWASFLATNQGILPEPASS